MYTSLNIFNHLCAKLEPTGYFEDRYSHHILFTFGVNNATEDQVTNAMQISP